jgi:hypothetical protein
MAYTTINKSSEHFNTKLYTGTGATQAVTGVGFQPDFIWNKQRNGTYDHYLFNSLSGTGKYMKSNTTGSEGTNSDTVTSFDSDGFTLGNAAGNNGSGNTMASWNWKAGTSISGATVGLGTLKTYTGSVNTTAGFSVIKYTGNGTAGHQFPHGLGVAPKMVIVKRTNSSAQWIVYHTSTGSTGATYLNDTGGFNTVQGFWNNSAPNSTSMPLGTDAAGNGNGDTYIAYCFAEKTGYSKFGKLISNGSDDGAFTYTGFAPKFVMLKPNVTDAWSHWYMFDTARKENLNDMPLYANLSTQEGYYGGSPATNYAQIDILSNGFKIRTGSGWGGGSSGRELIYMAFGQSIVGSNGVTAKAR